MDAISVVINLYARAIYRTHIGLGVISNRVNKR